MRFLWLTAIFCVTAAFSPTLPAGQDQAIPKGLLPYHSVAFSPDGKRIATGCGVNFGNKEFEEGSGHFDIWDVSTFLPQTGTSTGTCPYIAFLGGAVQV